MLALRIIVGLGLAYTLLMLLAWLFQDRLAFPAPRASLPDPQRVGVEHGEQVQLVSGDGAKLVTWYLAPKTNPPQPPPLSPSHPTSPAAAADLPPPPVARQRRQRRAGPLPDPAVSRRRGSARADGDGDGRGGCRGGAGRGGPDSRVRAQRHVRPGWSPVSGQALGVRDGNVGGRADRRSAGPKAVGHGPAVRPSALYHHHRHDPVPRGLEAALRVV